MTCLSPITGNHKTAFNNNISYTLVSQVEVGITLSTLGDVLVTCLCAASKHLAKTTQGRLYLGSQFEDMVHHPSGGSWQPVPFASTTKKQRWILGLNSLPSFYSVQDPSLQLSVTHS